VPTEPVYDSGAFADQILAVVDEEPQLPAGVVEVSGGWVWLS
jgi:hypothetical protein